MIILRSAVYSVIFFIWALIASLVTYAAAKIQGYGPVLRKTAKIWVQGAAVLEKYILNLDFHIAGKENLPKGACIVAMQHQSEWETMKLVLWFDEPAIVLKKSLLEIPLWGPSMRIYGSIPVARTREMKDLKNMLRIAGERKAEGRPIVIFPQGTRTPPGVKKPLQAGVGVLYEYLKIPVVPVTLNSAEFWGKDAFKKYPGTVEITYHPPIPAGLTREELMDRLDKIINA